MKRPCELKGERQPAQGHIDFPGDLARGLIIHSRLPKFGYEFGIRQIFYRVRRRNALAVCGLAAARPPARFTGQASLS